MFFAFVSCEKTSPSQDQKEYFMKFFHDAYFNQAVDLLAIDNDFFLLVNHTNDDNETWIVLRCVDSYGNLKWDSRYGYSDGINNRANSFIKLTNNTIAIVGASETDSDNFYSDIEVLIVDPAEKGAIIFDSVYNETMVDNAFALAERDAGGVMVFGTKKNTELNTISRYKWIFDSNFNTELVGANGEIEIEYLGDIVYSNSKYYLPGSSNLWGQNSASITELNTTGEETDYFPKLNVVNGYFNELEVVDYPKMLVCGLKKSGSNGASDAYISMIDFKNETVNWELDFGSSSNDDAKSIAYTINNEILVTGKINRSNNNDIYVLKISDSGIPLDTLYFGSDGDEISVKMLPDSNNPDAFIVFGTSDYGDYSHSVLIKSKF